MATEEPEFKLISENGEFQIREYDPKIIAQVKVEGDFDEASSKGFKLLADYIFGNNYMRNSERRKMRMKDGESPPLHEEVEMTGLVLLVLNDQIVVRGPANVVNMISPDEMVEFGVDIQQKWVMSFSLPAKYTLNNAPIPKNPAVRLREKEGELVVTRRFSNFVSKEKVDDLGGGLLVWANEKGLVIEGSVRIARYDPMWTIPFLRRNEIHLSVKM